MAKLHSLAPVLAFSAYTLPIVRADINHPIRHGGRGLHLDVPEADGVLPLQLQAANIVDAKHRLIRVPALHVVPVELRPVRG